jgi:hypothetical protein
MGVRFPKEFKSRRSQLFQTSVARNLSFKQTPTIVDNLDQPYSFFYQKGPTSPERNNTKIQLFEKFCSNKRKSNNSIFCIFSIKIQ